MPAMANKRRKTSLQVAPAGYDVLLADVACVIEEARRAAVRSVNAVMTATYWFVGRRIVEEEQQGSARALRRNAGRSPRRRSHVALRARVWTAQLVPDACLLPRASRDSADAVCTILTERVLVEEIEKTRQQIEGRRKARSR